MDIGIIGYGFVGKAVHYGLSRRMDEEDIRFRIYDPFLDFESDIKPFHRQHNITASFDDIYEFHSCDFIFVCLPTPTNFQTGQQDLSAFHEVLGTLNGIQPTCLVVIKSTVKPGTTSMLRERYTNLEIVFNPEFLTEANYLDDFVDQNRIVIGGHDYLCFALQGFYREGWPDAEYYMMWYDEAELVKYVANTLLAVKVSFFNEIHNLCLTTGWDYDTIIEAVTRDPRLGTWGTIVPGPDGNYGFGGKCLPKDTVTFIDYFFQHMNKFPPVIQGAWITNNEVREVKDWIDIKGASTEYMHEAVDKRHT